MCDDATSEEEAFFDRLRVERLEKEIKTLRARCARLRAALAGVVLREGPEASIESFDAALTTLRQVDDANVTTPWAIKLSHLIAALEVLRETAEEVKT